MDWTGSLLYGGVLIIIFISNNLLIIGEARYCGTQKQLLDQCGEILGQSNSSATDEFPISMRKSSLMRGLSQFYNPWKKIFQNQYLFKPSKNDAIDSDLYEDGLDRKLNEEFKLREEPVLNMKQKIKKIKKTDEDRAKVLNMFEEDINSKICLKEEESQNMAIECNKDVTISTAYPPKRKMTLSFFTVITEPYDEEPDDIKAAVGPSKIKIATQKSCTSNQVLIIKAPSCLGTLPVIVVKDNDDCSLTLTIKNKTDDEDKLLKNNCLINQRNKEKDEVAPQTHIKPEFNLINSNDYTPKKKKKPQKNYLYTPKETKLNPELMDLKSFLLQIQDNHKSSLSPIRSQNIKNTKEKKMPMYGTQKDLQDYPHDYIDITTTRNNITDLQSKINENLIEQLILLKKIKMS